MLSNELYHRGTPQMYDYDPHGSGRYRQGSGENPHQDVNSWIENVQKMKAEGKSEKEICDALGISTAEYRDRYSQELEGAKARRDYRIREMRAHGYSNSEIARRMNITEGTVRNVLKEKEDNDKKKVSNTAEELKNELTTKRYLDVGAGAELELGVTKTKLNAALNKLQSEGYEVYRIQVEQATDKNKKTWVKVLAPPGTKWADVQYNQKDIQPIQSYSSDGGDTFRRFEFPSSLDSSRIKVNYNEEGGIDKDGTIEIRRGLKDLNLGEGVNYAQVRIAVDGTHYLKGMALYSDDIPDGYDVVFNTNKHVGTPMLGSKDNTVLKTLKTDADGNIDAKNPFGALPKANGQSYYEDPNGKYVKVGESYRLATKSDKDAERYSLSPINKLKEQGDWDDYSRTLASQMLSKQPRQLIRTQLNMTYAQRAADFDEICACTNPVVKKKLLMEFADKCDAAAVHLKAAALPRQSTKVILPITTLKDDEIYAPSMKDGETVVLIRYPHGGLFEIPTLRVNNHNKLANSVIKNSSVDAVGINANVAARLSGADFDGDTAVVIPVNSRVKIQTKSPLKGLKDFDPKESYPGYPGMKVMSNTQTEMGKISNLITDMTLKGATDDELARAVRHSMVVIDAEKHKLNYKLSEEQNGIEALKKRYQSKPDGTYGGSTTLISRAKGDKRIPQLSDTYKIDPETGKKIFTETGKEYEKPVTRKVKGFDENGKAITKEYYVRKDGGLDEERRKGVEYQTVTKRYLTKTTNMAATDDAYTLSSGLPVENLYADYANKCKALANKSRKIFVNTDTPKVDPVARKTYAPEVASLEAKLNNALKNAPRERQAQIIANEAIRSAKAEDPSLKTDKDALKKISSQELAIARASVGASKKDVLVNITPNEWKAIEARAISGTKLMQILNNTDMDKVREYSIPRDNKVKFSAAQIANIKALQRSGFTIKDIADKFGCSVSTINKYLKSSSSSMAASGIMKEGEFIG